MKSDSQILEKELSYKLYGIFLIVERANLFLNFTQTAADDTNFREPARTIDLFPKFVKVSASQRCSRMFASIIANQRKRRELSRTTDQ